MKNYWKAIVISTVSVWIIWSINMTLNNFRTWTNERFFESLWTYSVLYVPFSILIAWSIYYVRKNIFSEGGNY